MPRAAVLPQPMPSAIVDEEDGGCVVAPASVARSQKIAARAVDEGDGEGALAGSSVAQGMSEAISLAKFQQSLLGVVHDNALLEKRVHELDAMRHEQAAATQAAQKENALLQARLDEASRAQEESDERGAAAQKAAEDERYRHALHARLAGEKATAAQAKLKQQGQQLYALEEQCRSRTAEASRLRIEKEGAEALIATFQGRLEEVSKVIDATARVEKACKGAINDVRTDQAELRSQLHAAEEVQRAAAPRAQLEQRLKRALRDIEEARSQEREQAEAAGAKDRELDTINATLTRTVSRLTTAQERAAADHAQLVAAEAQRQATGEQLHRAQANSLQLIEKSESLMRQQSQSTTVERLLLRELAHADANAHVAEGGLSPPKDPPASNAPWWCRYSAPPAPGPSARRKPRRAQGWMRRPQTSRPAPLRAERFNSANGWLMPRRSSFVRTRRIARSSLPTQLSSKISRRCAMGNKRRSTQRCRHRSRQLRSQKIVATNHRHHTHTCSNRRRLAELRPRPHRPPPLLLVLSSAVVVHRMRTTTSAAISPCPIACHAQAQRHQLTPLPETMALTVMHLQPTRPRLTIMAAASWCSVRL